MRSRDLVFLNGVRGAFLSAFLMLFLALGVTAPAQVVTNTASSGPGTLRSAITNAANGAIITFDPSLSGATITLSNTLTINTNLTIDASALPGGIQINGNGHVTIFVVARGTTNVFNSLTITNGVTDNAGAGIMNSGTLMLTNCTLSGNYGINIELICQGGGINNGGTLTMNRCTLSGNYGVQQGGGICNNGTMTLNQCTLSDNSTTGKQGGGGVFNEGTATLNECTLSGNSAGYGGGILNLSTLTLNQCTLTGNIATNGGGIYISLGVDNLNQCTLTGNIATNGGGIYISARLMMTNTIVGENSGSLGVDIYNNSSATYGGSNLVQSVYSAGNINRFTGPAPLTNSPNLAPLGNYGGPTETMPPLPGSPAIGAGSVAANTFSTDQRGYPRTQNGLIDLGAVELPTVQPFTATPTNGTAPLSVQFNSTNVDSDGSAITGWNWSYGDGTNDVGQYPFHVYSTTGNFSPGLIVTNSLGLALTVSGPIITALPLLVTNPADNGPGTLRSALANAVSGSVIAFDPSLSGATITLASTLTINTNLTIDASMLPGGIQINGSGSVQVFNVASNITVFLNALTIINGHADDYGYEGGGINNSGTLTLTNCTLSGNSAMNSGGGIENVGSLTLNQCNLFGNSSEGQGGGINNSGTATLNQCSLVENSATTSFGSGGGINNVETVTLNQCILWGNIATGSGGGVFNDDATLTLNQCTLSENSAPVGAGIFNNGPPVPLIRGTLSGNNAENDGGGISNGDTVTLNQCTLSGNSASYEGGGIGNYGTVKVGPSYSYAEMSITNTIVAGNICNTGPDIYNEIAAVTYGGSNLVQSVSNVDSLITGPAPLTNSPELAPLGNYGGPTQTMPPLPGSPAIGAGSVAANTFSTDQRGYPRTQNGLIDLGAVELPTVQPFTATPTNGTASLSVQFNSTNVDSDGSAITGWNWSFGDTQTSVAQNPSHVYSTTGTFSPGLIVTNSLGLALTVSGPTITVLPLTIAPTSVGITGSGASAFIQFAFTNATGLSFSILATNNITAPVSTWPVIGTATENPAGSGQYQFADPNPATNAGEYYILRQP